MLIRVRPLSSLLKPEAIWRRGAPEASRWLKAPLPFEALLEALRRTLLEAILILEARPIFDAPWRRLEALRRLEAFPILILEAL